MRGKLILENGKIFEGKIFGEIKNSVGELTFNTNMSGYQEFLTDPAVQGQISIMTYPMIGNYGINTEDMESNKIHLNALIIKEDAKLPNNFRCEMTLEGFLRQYNVVGFKGVDTRHLTQIIREEGSMKALITTEDLTKKEIAEMFKEFSMKNLVASVSTTEILNCGDSSKKIGILDLGVRNSTIDYLKEKGYSLTILPYNTKAEEIISLGLSGLYISNGPGNPEDLKEVSQEIKKLAGEFPILAEGLGMHVVALAFDGKVEKLKFAHCGEYPVRSIETKKFANTSQNTSYVVSVLPKDFTLVYEGINTKTIEGMKNQDLKIMAVQYMPDLYPESKDIMDDFLALV